MTSTTTQSATLVAATVSTGLMAGLYFAFDISVMPGLGRGDDQTYVTAMRNINDAIDNGLFGLLFLGAFLATGVAAAQQQRGGRPDAARWGWTAFGLYALSLVVTAAINIPLNTQLARAGADFGAARSRFGARWTGGNIVRTVACTAALAALGRALTLHGRGSVAA
ncbi:anthrone oxygenase family protein [Streptomyces sp. NPDC002138]|uniref:anthrone oxygenase family protein n=2 Tax=unclassified Streptomyces TaxID=2593676 RepID=UPI00332FA5E2